MTSFSETQSRPTLSSVHADLPGERQMAAEGSPRPLVVDLDGTLLRSDFLFETFFDSLGQTPSFHLRTFWKLFDGKAALKHHLAAIASPDFASLPYDASVLDLIHDAKKQGRPIYLASGANEKLALGVAKHLGLFDGVFASDAVQNLSQDAKAAYLVERFGERGFDYAGNSSDDLPVWKTAHRAYAANLTKRLEPQLRQAAPDAVVVSRASTDPMEWLRAFRVHQYVKNLLIFVPLLTSHSFDAASVIATVIAFVAFSLSASAVYIINDLIDLNADRGHPTKKDRPFAAGRLSLAAGTSMAPVLLLVSLICAMTVSWQLVLILLGYLFLTTAYSLSLKRKMIVDIVVLAILYTSRIVAGAVSIDVAISHWLAMFSLFFFTGLALIKRYTELTVRQDAGLASPTSRNYLLGDLPIVAALAAAAGMNAVTIFALYISSDTVTSLYRRPGFLWLIAPLLLYWFARALMLAHRRFMNDDPIVFALRDQISLLTLGVIVGLVILAI